MLKKPGRALALLVSAICFASMLAACGETATPAATSASVTTAVVATTSAAAVTTALVATTTSAVATTAMVATTAAASSTAATTSGTTTAPATTAAPTTTAVTTSVATTGAAGTTTAAATGPTPSAAACPAPIAAASTLKPKIGIALQVSIPPLQSSVDGFKKGLASCGFIEGQNVTYDFKDGQNDIPTLQTIGLRFKDEKLDLILAVGTNAMIQMYQTNKDTGVPIVFASITDPYKALPDVIKSPTEHSFLTGIQAFPPVDQGFQVLKQFLPNAKKIGVISNSKEANSKAVVDTMQAQAGPLGYTIDLKGINAESDVLAASQALANDKIDVFLAQTDTTVSNAFESMVSVALANKIPIIALDSGYGIRGAEVSLGVDYFASGVDSARLSSQILGGSKVDTVPIEKLKSVSVAVNIKAAGLIGVTIPDAILSQATKKYDEITPPKK